MGDYDYVKVLLYVYPKLQTIADACFAGAELKALLSFRSFQTLDCAVKISENILNGKKLRELDGKMREALSLLNEEEMYLLEYKYFRRASELSGRFADTALSASQREYYRRQNALLKKVAFLLLARGITEESYLKEYHVISPFSRIYRAVKEGRERLVMKKRTRCGINFQNSASCGTDAFLPCKTKKPMAATAATVRQTTAICRADGVEEAAGSSMGGSTGSAAPTER